MFYMFLSQHMLYKRTAGEVPPPAITFRLNTSKCDDGTNVKYLSQLLLCPLHFGGELRR